MQTKIIERYFFFGLLAATLVFTFLIFRPFWIVLVLGISFSIVLYPLYQWFKNRKLPNWLSSLLTVFIFTLILCGPLLGIATLVFNQSQDVYYRVMTDRSDQPFMKLVEDKVNDILPDSITFNANDKLKDFIYYLSHNIANIFTSAVSAFFSFLLILLIMFYFLKEGEKSKKAIIQISPLGEENDEKIISKLTQAVNEIIKGSLFIALVQGILLGFGFWLFDIPNGALWGVVAAACSLIPTFGTALVSVPAIIFLFLSGNTTSAVGLLIWAAIIVGMVDNVLSPFIIGKGTNIPPILILFSVLGGIVLVGPVGILIGPLSLSLLYALISIYKNEVE